ncbi:MAG: DUF1415 family protein [Polyangiaceae bacterium]|nr:DUF1415 family protein [Polyangiaceae bacterium]
MSTHFDELLRTEALRVYQRYLNEIVLAYGFCPWAERAISLHRVVERVVLSPDGEAAEKIVSLVAELATDPNVEVALLLLPKLELDRTAFDRFAQKVRQALETSEYRAVFALAAFHPFAEPIRRTSESFIPFLRRTPDPTLQLVRYSLLERVREGTPQGTHFLDVHTLDLASLTSLREEKSLREKISDHNLEQAEAVGIARLEQIFADIRADRDRSYRAIFEAQLKLGDHA